MEQINSIQTIDAINTQTFDSFDKDMTQPLTLEMLRRTIGERDYTGITPLKGIFHYDLLDGLIEEGNRRGLNIVCWDLFAAKNNDKAQPGVTTIKELQAKYGEFAVEAHCLRRIFANMRITNFDDDTYTTNLCVAYHQKGIQIAGGNNVKICHNQTMLGTRDFFVSTYSERGNGREANLPTSKELIPIVGKWLDTIEQRVVDERNRIERMKQVILTDEQIFTLLGMLMSIRTAVDSKYGILRDNEVYRKNPVYPLNSTQLNQFTEKIMLKRIEQGELSLWDFYDTATALYKARYVVGKDSKNKPIVRYMEIPNIISQNRSMCSFLEEQFPNAY